ncbi:polyhydroxyalkanoate synthesis repressor PhaR [Comamonas serinivorans]|uniref:Polyhydroxyalkanoate synthesis repressor PhaR n=1 Tax=Comamonas serinivorans TaxID=1082851 RepID=A0A1Y0EQ21_9BURK|nr:polyhydroxyalkanoate synthesis repressor PhaR [Comamonas serinivorans]ARU05676.1 polyhydroxyalkanoate synthesis repressor PhaR [Comamonas serinivorans]
MPQDHDSTTADDSGVRVIKKYPNRRLYDSATSTYITLAQVKEMVIAGERVRVRDAKTSEDLTRSILLQIILEEEAGGAPMFSEAALANIIRFYGHTMQGFMGAYLERNVAAFSEMQSRMQDQAKSFSPEAWAQYMKLPANPMGAVQEQMQEQMKKQTEQMLEMFGLKR